MPTESTQRPLANRILRVVLGSGELADRDLLARFTASRDEEAFAELVRRHGPMVLGVCRRVTGHGHDAEDAFQAAFVVLARRAGQVRNPDQLANWLYGVAYRTALEARAARRRVQEQAVPAAPEPAAAPEPDDTADLRRVIDEELARLPDKYRSAVVLCDLEGLARTEAAARLKIPEGTLSSRLAYARKVLADRLTRRGVTASSAAVATTLGREATATIPREFVLLTARLARATAGGSVPPGLLPDAVSTLVEGVMRAMLVNRLRLTLGAALVTGLLGLGAYGLAQVPPVATPAAPNFALPQQNNRLNPIRDDQDENPISQPKPKQPQKFAAKGIEDDEVPSGSSAAQAVVRLEEGKLIVRQRTFYYQPVTQQMNGTMVTSYQTRAGVQASTHDASEVSVFDMKGNRLQPKAWKDKLKVDVHVLIGYDGKLPQPRELALYKEDTLFVVLPTAPTVPTPTPPGVRAGARTAIDDFYSAPTPARNSTPAPSTPRIAPPAVAPPSQNTPRPAPVPLPLPGTAESVPFDNSFLPAGVPTGPTDPVGLPNDPPLPPVEAVPPAGAPGLPSSNY